MPINSWRLHQAITLFATATLTALPLSGSFAPWQPQWITTALLFWAISRPGQAGFGMAWTFGLLNDLITGSWLGIHPLSYCTIVFLCTRLFRLWQLYDTLRLLFPITLLLALHTAYLQLLSVLLSNVNPGLDHWMSFLPSLLLWTILYLLLDRNRGRRNLDG